MMCNQIVYEFTKSAMEKVQIQLSSYKGSDLIDIRVCYQERAYLFVLTN